MDAVTEMLLLDDTLLDKLYGMKHQVCLQDLNIRYWAISPTPANRLTNADYPLCSSLHRKVNTSSDTTYDNAVDDAWTKKP